MNYHDIVLKLIGPIEPIGETNTDNERYENLKNMTGVVDRLIFDISMVMTCKYRTEYSMKRAGEFAYKFLKDLGIEE